MMTLKEFVKHVIDENAKDFRGSFINEDGKEFEFGSKEHVADLESSLRVLIKIRDQQRRGSASRMTYAHAVNRLKNQLDAARRHAIKHGLIDAVDMEE